MYNGGEVDEDYVKRSKSYDFVPDEATLDVGAAQAKSTFRQTGNRQKVRSDHVKIVNSVQQENGVREPLKKIDRNRDMAFSYNHTTKPDIVEISQEFEKCDSDFLPATIIESTIVSDELDSIGNLLDSDGPEKTDLYSDSLSPLNNENEDGNYGNQSGNHSNQTIIVTSPARTFKLNEDVDVISVDRRSSDIENITPNLVTMVTNLDSGISNGMQVVVDKNVDHINYEIEEKLTNGTHDNLAPLEEEIEPVPKSEEVKSEVIISDEQNEVEAGGLELGDLGDLSDSSIFMKVGVY